MKLPEDYDDQPKFSAALTRTMVIVTVFMVAVLVLVLVMNRDTNTNKPQAQLPSAGQEPVVSAQPGQTETADRPQDDALTPSDFDFWDMYPEETQQPPEESAPPVETAEDPATDGRHTLVTSSDGTEEWVIISPYLPKHDYDFTKLVCQSDLMKYFVDGKQVSYVGVDISKYQDYVDFIKLKKAGIQFVMIRVGARGYGSGQIMVDDYFTDNLKRATDAGLQVGLYFSSQAISTDEAIEEANLVLENIGDYEIKYPIAFDMEEVANDTARIDHLTRDERTKIAAAFLSTIQDAGYNAILYGNKEWLIKKVDLSRLTAYDTWLSQPGDLPDYPYRFSMWQYSNTGMVDGIVGYVNLNISFIDYTEK